MDLAGSAVDLLDLDLLLCAWGKVLTVKMLKHSWEGWVFQTNSNRGVMDWLDQGFELGMEQVALPALFYVFWGQKAAVHFSRGACDGKGTLWSVKA